MKRISRFLIIVLAVVLLISVIAGCTGSTTTAPTTGSTTTKTEGTTKATTAATTTEAGPVALASGIPKIIKTDPAGMLWMKDISPITLTAYVNNMNSNEFKWGNDPTTQYITERTGVTLEIEYAPDTEGTRLNLMLASGEKLPDLIGYVHQASPYAADLVSGEYVLCAEDLINEFAPEFWELYPTQSQKELASATSDGKMWAFANGYALDGQSHYGYMHGYCAVRSDILEALGRTNLDIKTLDDFYAVLDEFSQIKDQFPEVEYPVYLKGIRAQFSSFFGDIGAGDIRYNASDDSFYFWFENDAGYNTMKMFNKLYRDGNLKEESIITSNPVIDDLGAGKALFYFENNVWASSSANTPLHTNVDEKAWFMPCYPFSGADGKALRTFKGVSNNGGAWWISSDCQNVERALGFMEYNSTEEGILTINNGIFGENWEVGYDSEGFGYPKFIGEAGELAHSGKVVDAKKKFGFNNYESSLWLYHEFEYNFLWNYDVNIMNSVLPENLIKARIIWYKDTTDNEDLTGVPNMVAVDGSSDEGVLLVNLQNIYNSEVVKTVFADSDADFEAKYQAMKDALMAAGEEEFWSMYRPLFEAKLKLYQAVIGK